MTYLPMDTTASLSKSRSNFLLFLYGLLIASTLIILIRTLRQEDVELYDRETFELSNDPPSKDWDVLIFTQQWPVTECFHWKKESKNNQCNLPKKKDVWTIHGVWPTKLDTLGPNFCNKSSVFDVDQLTPILDRLFLVWPEIQGGTEYDSLWQHEWLKHGTCAAALEQLGNELKYFNQGLNWHSDFAMSEVLEKSGILPDSNSSLVDLNAALVKSLGKNPSIHCLYDHKTDISYLSEIRICFDKNFELIDCDGVRTNDLASYGQILSNCHPSKLIYYPSNVPPTEQDDSHKNEWNLLNIGKYFKRST